MIRQFYIQNYSSKRIQDYQFENFIITENNKKEVEITKVLLINVLIKIKKMDLLLLKNLELEKHI